MSDLLSSLQGRIARELSWKSECFITHPAEMSVLQHFSTADLREFAHRNGWRVAQRLGGRQVQFYNNATERLANEESGSR